MTPVHGIIFEPNFDRVTPRGLDIAGMDVSKMSGRPVYWGFDEVMSGLIGKIKEARTVLSLADCRNDADRGLWDVAGGLPFARASAEIFDEYATALLREKMLAWSGFGVVLEWDGRTIKRAQGRAIAAQALGGGAYRVFPGLG